MPYAYTKQPLRGLYLLYQLITTIFIRFPIWALLSLPRSWRPRASWNLKRTWMIRLLRHSMSIATNVGPIIKLPNHLSITPGVEIKGVWVGAVPDLIVGELKTWAKVAGVTSIRVPGYWVHKSGSNIKVAAPPLPGEKVVYALHGGGYVRLSAHPKDVTANIARGLVEHIDSVHRVFSMEYRLSSGKPFKPAGPFPSALLDAIAGYNYLVNIVGFSPSDIIVEGDSAGGNLAHALTRYLIEYRDTTDTKLPGPPGALILLSPWCYLGQNYYHTSGSAKAFIDIDYIGSDGGLSYATGWFLGPHGRGFADLNRYVSPSSLAINFEISFKDFPRTFIVAGGSEVLFDQIQVLKSRMIADLGEGNGVKEGEGKVRYYEAPDGVHDYIVFPWHEPERTDTLRAIAAWVAAS